MLISVIVAVYNMEKYLKECLDSLVNQTYQKLEVIMVDDGSKDSSGNICDEYAERYKNFQVVHKKNEGLGLARNTGLEIIQGEYVFFLDADDYLPKEAIEILWNNLKVNEGDVCKGGFRRITDEKEVLMVRRYEDEVFKGSEVQNKLLPRLIGSSPNKKDSIEMSVWGTLFAVEPIRKYNLRFCSERVLISEDMVFNIDYMQHAHGGCLISELCYEYRYNPDSLTMSYRENRFEASCYFYAEMKKKLTLLGYEKETLLRLQKTFFIYVRKCISQESYHISKYGSQYACQHIKEICKNEMVREAIKTYPVAELGFPQRVFLKMIEHNMYFLLFFLLKLRMI